MGGPLAEGCQRTGGLCWPQECGAGLGGGLAPELPEPRLTPTTLAWRSPSSPRPPAPPLFARPQTQFKAAGATQFGSGWAWLVADKSGKLTIEKTPNAVTPVVEGKTPILTMVRARLEGGGGRRVRARGGIGGRVLAACGDL